VSTPGGSRDEFRLTFRMYSVRISAGTLGDLTAVFHRIPQSLRRNMLPPSSG
jgi:hypothetical protein